MYYCPIDFGNLSVDELTGTGALTSAISVADLNKIKFLSNQAAKDTGPEANFQIMVASGQLERPIGTVLPELEVADFQYQENFIEMFKKNNIYTSQDKQFAHSWNTNFGSSPIDSELENRFVNMKQDDNFKN